jgi:hypothetical protein
MLHPRALLRLAHSLHPRQFVGPLRLRERALLRVL